jgi:predicted acyl esterase
VTSPLSANTTVVGGGAVRLWVRSSTPDADFQATISEVRPDGKETFVQGGWLRGKARKLDSAKSTQLEPVLSFRQEDFAPLAADKWTDLTIPLYYQGHVYRAGSRIRVTISAPNGDQPVWSFGETVPSGTSTIKIARTGLTPSSLVLPVVPGVAVPTGLPPCPGLRGEPCRTYQAFTNRTAPL